MAEADLATDYFDVDRILKSIDCDIGASECHGVLCGMLCSTRNFQVDGWLGHTTGYQSNLDAEALAAKPALTTLYQQTLTALDADDLSFTPLLPDDEYPLSVRVESLGAWCRGFLSGFGLGDSYLANQLSADTQDFLRDLQKISQVNPTDLDAQGSESALFEVQEYARMGALLMREELISSVQVNSSEDQTEYADPSAGHSIH